MGEVKRQTVSFSPEIWGDIEEYRKKQTPIPSRSAAVLELVAKGLSKK